MLDYLTTFDHSVWHWLLWGIFALFFTFFSYFYIYIIYVLSIGLLFNLLFFSIMSSIVLSQPNGFLILRKTLFGYKISILKFLFLIPFHLSSILFTFSELL